VWIRPWALQFLPLPLNLLAYWIISDIEGPTGDPHLPKKIGLWDANSLNFGVFDGNNLNSV